MSCSRLSQLRTLAVLIATLTPGPSASAGPNLMALGDYGSVPFKRAEGRDSFSRGEIVFEFADPAFDFGRVVVRSNQPSSVVRRDLFVGFNGTGLTVNSSSGQGSGSVQLQEVQIWLRVHGRLRPGQRYEWELQGGGDQEIRDGLPALIPMFWADGEQIAAEVTIAQPDEPDDGRIQRLLIPHGVVTLPDFRRQTGAAWVVLMPRNFGQQFTVARFSLREVQKDVAADPMASMPIPVRYVPIRSAIEDRIELALTRGAQALRQRRNAENFWEAGDTNLDVLTTALAAAALGELGEDDATLRPTLDWLDQQTRDQPNPWNLETVAARLYTLSRFGGVEAFRATIHGDIFHLAGLQTEDGGWPAGAGPERSRTGSASGSRPDHGATSSVLLALREARLAGAEVDARLWRNMLQYWTDAQAYDGGFREKLERYGGVGQATTTTYTALGAAALIAALDMASGLGGRRCGSYRSSSHQLRAIEAALKWLEENYQEQFRNLGSFVQGRNPYAEAENLMWLGAISGISHINGKDHFAESAEDLLQHYDENSGMFGVRRSEDDWVRDPDLQTTSAALVILGTGSSPTVCQRIIVGDDERGWGQYSGDAQHLVHYLGQRRGKQFNWRRTDIDRSVGELAKTPILLLKAAGPFEWSQDQWDKIREYCLAGGTVLIDAAEDHDALRESILSALKRTFPEWSLRELGEDHALFSIEDEIEAPPSVMAVGNGFRDFLFLPAQSWSCHFHLYQVREHEDSFRFVNNLLTYATDGTPLPSTFVPSTYAARAVAARAMNAAKLEIGGAVPAWPNLLATMDRLMQANYRLGVHEVEDPGAAAVLWVTVTGAGRPSDEAAERIRAALRAGTFVFADVISGSPDWDENFRAFLRGLDDAVVLEKLDRGDPVFTGAIPGTQGFDVTEVELRTALHSRFSTRGRCDLYRIRFDGRPAGVYSAHDIASGIGHHYFPDCRGVVPRHARRIAMNVFLTAYAWKRAGRAEQRARAGGGS